VIFPPTPGFYQRPATLEELVDQTVVRMLDQFDIHLETGSRWGEKSARKIALHARRSQR
jgi:4-hydroxy-3-polyprenylbenzoate decarboxylase